MQKEEYDKLDTIDQIIYDAIGFLPIEIGAFRNAMEKYAAWKCTQIQETFPLEVDSIYIIQDKYIYDNFYLKIQIEEITRETIYFINLDAPNNNGYRMGIEEFGNRYIIKEKLC